MMLLATGSPTFTKTIGIVRVSRWRATVAAVEVARMMSLLDALAPKVTAGTTTSSLRIAC
jgi:hypothetical protein